MPAEGPPSVARASVPRASAKLRFDQFFASSVASATPSTPMEAMEPVAEPVAEPMAEPMVEPVAELEEPASADPGDEEPGEDDDLDQFQGWLRGLTQ
jgi:hypothetical protein